MKIKNAQGVEVDVPDDIAGGVEALEKKFTEDITAKDTELADLKVKLEEAEKKAATAGAPAGGDSKDENMKNLRDQISAKAGEIDAIKKDIDTVKAGATAAIIEAQDAMITALVGPNKEMKEKVDFYMKQFEKPGETLTAEQRKQRVADAVTLVQGTRPSKGILDGLPGGGFRGSFSHAHDAGTDFQPNDNLKLMAKTFGVSEADMKKYNWGNK